MRYNQQIKEFLTNTRYQSFVNSMREVTIFSGGNFIAQIIMMIYAILVARSLGPSQLGVFSGLYAIVGISVMCVNWGLDTWMLKEAFNYTSIKLLTGKILSIKLLFSIIWGGLLFIFLPVIRPNIFSQMLVLVVLSDVICDVLFNTIIASWNIEKKVKTILSMLFLSRLGKILFLIFLITMNWQSPLSIGITRFLISGIILIISFIKNKPILFQNIRKDFIEIIRSSAVFGYSEILAVIYANVDVAILTILSVSSTVGLYSPASGIIHALFIIPNSVYSFILPIYSKKFSLESKYDKKKGIKKILLYFFIVGLLMTIGVGISGQFFVVMLLGIKYVFTSQLLLILSPILLFKSVEFGLAAIIVVLGYQKKRLFPQFIAAMISIIANVALLPFFGVIGVAWIYFVSEFVLMMGYILIVFRLYKKNI